MESWWNWKDCCATSEWVFWTWRCCWSYCKWWFGNLLLRYMLIANTIIFQDALSDINIKDKKALVRIYLPTQFHNHSKYALVCFYQRFYFDRLSFVWYLWLWKERMNFASLHRNSLWLYPFLNNMSIWMETLVGSSLLYSVCLFTYQYMLKYDYISICFKNSF